MQRIKTTHWRFCCSDIVSLKWGVKVETSCSSFETTTAAGEPTSKNVRVSTSCHVTFRLIVTSGLTMAKCDSFNMNGNQTRILRGWFTCVCEFEEQHVMQPALDRWARAFRSFEKVTPTSPRKVTVRFCCPLKSLSKSQWCLACGRQAYVTDACTFVFIDWLVLCHWL